MHVLAHADGGGFFVVGGTRLRGPCMFRSVCVCLLRCKPCAERIARPDTADSFDNDCAIDNYRALPHPLERHVTRNLVDDLHFLTKSFTSFCRASRNLSSPIPPPTVGGPALQQAHGAPIRACASRHETRLSLSHIRCLHQRFTTCAPACL